MCNDHCGKPISETAQTCSTCDAYGDSGATKAPSKKRMIVLLLISAVIYGVALFATIFICAAIPSSSVLQPDGTYKFTETYSTIILGIPFISSIAFLLVMHILRVLKKRKALRSPVSAPYTAHIQQTASPSHENIDASEHIESKICDVLPDMECTDSYGAQILLYTDPVPEPEHSAPFDKPFVPAFPLFQSLHPDEDEEEDIYYRTLDVIYDTGIASVSMLQRHLRFEYAHAARIIDRLEEFGILGPFRGSKPREILLSREQAMLTIYIYYANASDVPAISHDDIQPDTLSAIDLMEGHEFEHWCASLLRKLDFQDVTVTKGSGDQGVDIVAEKDGVRYAIQCKCYSSDLGNKPVQEVFSGKSMYDCHVAVVMTNRHFTSGAKELAKVTGVLLWDRDKLQSMIDASDFDP